MNSSNGQIVVRSKLKATVFPSLKLQFYFETVFVDNVLLIFPGKTTRKDRLVNLVLKWYPFNLYFARNKVLSGTLM